MPREKVKISHEALMRRINRRLLAAGQVLRKTRPDSRARLDVGDYFIIDLSGGWLAGKDIDPEELAREIGALQPWEVVEGA